MRRFYWLGFWRLDRRCAFLHPSWWTCIINNFLIFFRENPFNYDENDLDLDGFCLSMGRELHEITAVSDPRLTSLVDYLCFVLITAVFGSTLIPSRNPSFSRPGTSPLRPLTGAPHGRFCIRKSARRRLALCLTEHLTLQNMGLRLRLRLRLGIRPRRRRSIRIRGFWR